MKLTMSATSNIALLIRSSTGWSRACATGLIRRFIAMCVRESFQTTGLATSQRPVILASGDFWGGTTDAVSPCKTADYAFGSNPPYALLTRVRDRPYSSFHRDVRAGIFPDDW